MEVVPRYVYTFIYFKVPNTFNKELRTSAANIAVFVSDDMMLLSLIKFINTR